MAVLSRSLLLTCLALSGAGCALWPEDGSLGWSGDGEGAVAGTGEGGAGQQAGDEVGDGQLGGLEPFAPTPLVERYSLVRFLHHADGTRTAILTVPKGQGVRVKERLEILCTCDDRTIAPAVFEEITDGGGSLLGNPQNQGMKFDEAAMPTYQALEDLVLVRGTEADIEEALQAFDLWFNGSPQIEIKSVVFELLDSEEFQRGVEKVDGPLLENTDGETFIQSLSGSFPANTTDLGGILRLGFIDEDFELNAFLSFLEQEGLVQIISSPSVVVRSGVPAQIESLEKVPYLEPSGNISVSGTTQFKIGYNDVGVKLNVVPFLMGADTIHLVIYAEVSRLGQEVTVGQDDSGRITAPTTTKRVATTKVHVRDGTKVIIGGLKLTEERVSESKIPIIGDAPVVGWLFSSKTTETAVTDVYFVITPKVKKAPSIDPIGDIFDPFAEEDGP